MPAPTNNNNNNNNNSNNNICNINNNCQLTAINKIPELIQLRDLYSKEWPRHCVGFYCLDNFIRWLEKAPENKIKNIYIYTLNNDWRHHGLFIVIDRYQLYMNCLIEDKENKLLTKALSLLDWSNGYKVSSFLDRHRSAVMHLVKAQQLQLEYDILTVMYHMPRDLALKLTINCPEQFYIRPMSVDDAEMVDEVWPNRHEGSLFFIRRQIALNPNLGVYVKDTDELVAWCMRDQGGFLGVLQTKESHLRMGLGSLITRATVKLIAEMGDDIIVQVAEDNLPSRGVFDKLGFQITDTCYYLRICPTKPNVHWKD